MSVAAAFGVGVYLMGKAVPRRQSWERKTFGDGRCTVRRDCTVRAPWWWGCGHGCEEKVA